MNDEKRKSVGRSVRLIGAGHGDVTQIAELGAVAENKPCGEQVMREVPSREILPTEIREETDHYEEVPTKDRSGETRASANNDRIPEDPRGRDRLLKDVEGDPGAGKEHYQAGEEADEMTPARIRGANTGLRVLITEEEVLARPDT